VDVPCLTGVESTIVDANPVSSAGGVSREDVPVVVIEGTDRKEDDEGVEGGSSDIGCYVGLIPKSPQGVVQCDYEAEEGGSSYSL
jgi:hypothetical protein